MFKKIAIAVVVLIAALLAFAATKPEFTLVSQGDATSVTWAMQGPSPYLMKIMHVFLDMDSMVGKDFDTGLANLKAVAEK